MTKQKKRPYLSTSARRAAIMQVYKTDEWEDKVQRMNNMQVYAIYDSFCKDGYIWFDDYNDMHFRTPEQVKELRQKRKEAHGSGHQITLEEYLKEEEIKSREDARMVKEFERRQS